MAEKKIVWLDTVRVLASLLVIVSHYVECFSRFENFPVMILFFRHIGTPAVSLFFAVSGYLVNRSLARSSGLWNFYKWRMIRIVIPFVMAYIVLGSALMILGLTEPALAATSPFSSAIYKSGFPKEILLSMIPHDINLAVFLGLGINIFTGEWFIGTVIWLYMIAPFLNKMIRRAPLLTFAASILISIGTFYATQNLMLEGRIVNNGWIFLVRIPEFLLGMILAVYKDFFEDNRKKILCAAGAWTAIIGTIFFFQYSENFSLCMRLYPNEPRSLLISLTTIYLFFLLAEYLNEKFPSILARFNVFANVSYMSMLIQHVIIYIVAGRLDLINLKTFGLIYIFFLVTLMIIYTSRFVKIFSDPLENYFLKRKQTVI